MSNSGVFQADPVSPSGRRVLRPRQAPISPAVGATTPRAGRVTRSSAGYVSANASGGDAASQIGTQSRQPTRVSGQSHGIPATPDRRGGKRSRPQSGFYDEDEESDADNFYSSSASPAVEPPQSSRSARTRSLRSSRPANATPTKKLGKLISTPTKATRGRATPGKSTPRRATPRKSLPATATTAPADPDVIPDWLRLPYLMWIDVFKYASAPLDEREHVDWLLATSRVCRAFAEPCLTALYQCPPLLTRSMAHNLVALLKRDPSTTAYKYRQKVEKLRVDVQEIAAKTFRGQMLDFGALIACTPRLQVIDFTHEKDLPPFRSLDDSLRWHYPDAMFEALNGIRPAGESEAAPTKLIGWRWNRRLMGPNTDPSRIKSLHLTPAFANVKKLSLINYQVPSLRYAGKAVSPITQGADEAFIQDIAQAISSLPVLDYLSVESSTIVNDDFLSLLPKSLKFLELINCWEVSGEDFTGYLLSHGQKLEHIVLRHNQSLSLAFLTVMESGCPNLKTLSVDLKNYNHHEFYNDSDPNYAEVLTVDQVPKWPETLEWIELRNMKKWSAEAAEVLFQSLVDSAPTLPHLRHLDLKTMLDIPFRQRSALRDKWDAKLKRVFLRKKVDPKPFFSLRKAAVVTDVEITKVATKSPRKKARVVTASESEARRSSRIATHASNPSSRDSSLGRDPRAVRARPSYAEVDTDADDEDNEPEALEESEKSEPESEKNASDAEEDIFRHGMCDTVDIQLDNQKLAEITWQMDDFLDVEASDNPSDEDWDGDDHADGGYAW